MPFPCRRATVGRVHIAAAPAFGDSCQAWDETWSLATYKVSAPVANSGAVSVELGCPQQHVEVTHLCPPVVPFRIGQFHTRAIVVRCGVRGPYVNARVVFGHDLTRPGRRPDRVIEDRDRDAVARLQHQMDRPSTTIRRSGKGMSAPSSGLRRRPTGRRSASARYAGRGRSPCAPALLGVEQQSRVAALQWAGPHVFGTAHRGQLVGRLPVRPLLARPTRPTRGRYWSSPASAERPRTAQRRLRPHASVAEVRPVRFGRQCRPLMTFVPTGPGLHGTGPREGWTKTSY